MNREAQLVATFVELTDVLVDQFDVVELLTHLTDRCVEVLDVAAAGLLLADPAGNLRVVASSSEAMHTMELLELQSAEGPCVECFRTGQPIVNIQLTATDQPWPTFGPRAIAEGFVSVSAIPMRLRKRTIGALNLFRTSADALADRDIVAAQAFADVATIGILQNRAVEEANTVNNQLTAALNSRILIEQAKGMVAERMGIAMEQAFTKLRSHARAHNLSLSDLATQVVRGDIIADALDDDPKASPSPAKRTGQ